MISHPWPVFVPETNKKYNTSSCLYLFFKSYVFKLFTYTSRKIGNNFFYLKLIQNFIVNSTPFQRESHHDFPSHKKHLSTISFLTFGDKNLQPNWLRFSDFGNPQISGKTWVFCPAQKGGRAPSAGHHRLDN